jgi:DNA-binding NarL/FixJ family response regulator
MAKFSVLIVEDDEQILESLSKLITEHEGYELLAAVSSMEDGINALNLLQPAILLTDIGLPDGSGIEIIKAIDKKKLNCEAMVISGFQDENIVFQALEAGAKSYLLKHDEGHKIIDAIDSMMKGGAPISPIIARLMLQKFQKHKVAVQGLPESLTERQIAILKLVSQGFSSREISEKLEITYYTVTTHIKNIYNKLQVNSRSEALHEALKLGLI